MGFVKKSTIYKLVFEDPDLEGLVVRAKGVSIERFLAIATLSDGVDPSDPVEGLRQLDDLFKVFAAVLVDWNLEEEDGTVTPATLDGIRSLEIEFFLSIFDAWMTAIATVSGPLHKSSSAGSGQMELSLPMEALSESLVSSSTGS